MHTDSKFSEKIQEVFVSDAALSIACPCCGARPGEYCRSGGRAYFESHRTRRQKPAFQKHEAWVRWWKSMKVFEQTSTRKPLPRPADLEVPSQEELLRGAA